LKNTSFHDISSLHLLYFVLYYQNNKRRTVFLFSGANKGRTVFLLEKNSFASFDGRKAGGER
jgi:hypothetical protein